VERNLPSEQCHCKETTRGQITHSKNFLSSKTRADGSPSGYGGQSEETSSKIYP
jgi:hypothetical protein